jgi:hypothetical protein
VTTTSPAADVETRTNGRTTYSTRRGSKARSPLLPVGRPRRRRRRRSTVAAVLATSAYVVAITAGYLLVAPALRDDAEATPRAAEPATPASEPATATVGGHDALAMRSLAARAQRSVFLIEGAGVQGSGFIAWSSGGKSYLITSRTLVAGVLRDGGRTVFVTRGSSFWEADIAREDARSGLALLRVHDGIGKPLWARRGADSLETGGDAMVVPAGPDEPLAQAPVGAWQKGGFLLGAPANPLNVGAPVLGERGKVAGVVVAISGGGGVRVVPLGRACGPIRDCS